ncbi:MAG: glutathione synthase [Pseudanabaenaceae cyanobacterium bins.39]|nr:glutathione synthase [Pseudanabaenaceae cyanobacterium bins.39]
MKLAFIIDPIANLNPAHDTSVALMEAACRQGHQVFITQMQTLSIKDGQAWAFLQPVQIYAISSVEGKWQVPNPWYEVTEGEFASLETMDFVWMRPDPPVTIDYLYATYILDYVNPNKTRVLNAPQGIRAANEKMYALQFTKAIPKTIVSANKNVIHEFVADQGKAVMKPLGGKGGEGILFLETGDRNINSLIEISTNIGKTPVMVQEYLPAAQEGDKRIILLDGEPIGAVNRIPKSGEFRGNMAAGGSAAKVDITDREREICSYLAPTLRRDGLVFVGIDVIGGYLTEVNVTSPTGAREIDLFDGISIGDRVMDWLSANLPSTK